MRTDVAIIASMLSNGNLRTPSVMRKLILNVSGLRPVVGDEC